VILAVLLLPIVLLIGAANALETFDGAWRVVISCPAHTDDAAGARGYRYGFPAQVKDGVLHAQRKAEDAPGSLRIDGPIQPDGNADLIAKSLTGISRPPRPTRIGSRPTSRARAGSEPGWTRASATSRSPSSSDDRPNA
jgi:hypothetical protein